MRPSTESKRIAVGDATSEAAAPVVHERSYARRNPASVVHRARLAAILSTLQHYVDGTAPSWADFGCSNGFIIEQVVTTGEVEFSEVVGYDHSEALLEMARRKRIPKARFHQFDLMTPQRPQRAFGLVTCLETLEHVADYRVAFRNLYSHTAPEGILLISVPNETGLPGLVKLVTRRALRPNANADFFARTSKAAYAWCLVRNGYVDRFREPSDKGYGPHLGFDYRRLRDWINEEFVVPRRLLAVADHSAFLGMNRIFAYRKR